MDPFQNVNKPVPAYKSSSFILSFSYALFEVEKRSKLGLHPHRHGNNAKALYYQVTIVTRAEVLDIINIYQYGCQKFRKDLSNPARSSKDVFKKDFKC